MLRFKARRKDPTESPFLTPSQKRIMASLGKAMTKVRDASIRNEGQILDAILHGPPSRLIDLVPETPWYEAQEALQSELTGELLAAGQRYGAAIPSVQKAEVNFRFDADRPEAAAWAQKEAANLIVEVVEEQRAVVRDLAARASMGELAPRDAARQIRDVIGLTNQQAGWVENFRRRQVADLEAQGLSPRRVEQLADRATDRYHRRIHRYRSENIARTEILRASNEGREQAWGQALGEGFISPNSRKQWSANQDDRICAQCRDLDGTIVPLAGTFPNGEPPLHPSCRCDVLLIPAQPMGIEQVQALSDEQLDAAILNLIAPADGAAVPGLVNPLQNILDEMAGRPQQPSVTAPLPPPSSATPLRRGIDDFDNDGGSVSANLARESDEIQQALTDLELQGDLVGPDFINSENYRFTRAALFEPNARVARNDEFGVTGAIAYNTRTSAMMGADELEAFGGDYMHIEYLGSTGTIRGVGSALTREALRDAQQQGVPVYVEPATSGAETFWRKMGFIDAPEADEGWLKMDTDTIKRTLEALGE